MDREDLLSRYEDDYALPMSAYLEFVRENEENLFITSPIKDSTHALLPENIATWVREISACGKRLQGSFPANWPPLDALAREYSQSLRCIQWSDLIERLRTFVPHVRRVIRETREQMDAVVCFLLPVFLTTKSNMLFTAIFSTLMAGEEIYPDFVVNSLSACHRLAQTTTRLSSRFVVFYVDDMIFSGQQISSELMTYMQAGRGGHQTFIEFYPIVPFSTSRGRKELEDTANVVDYIGVEWFAGTTTYVSVLGLHFLRAGLFPNAAAMNAFEVEVAARYEADDLRARMLAHLYGQFLTNGGLKKPPLIMEHKIADFKSISSKLMLRAFYIGDDEEGHFLPLVTGSDEDSPFYKNLKWKWRGKVTHNLSDLKANDCAVCSKPATFKCSCNRALYCSGNSKHCQLFHWSVLGHSAEHV